MSSPTTPPFEALPIGPAQAAHDRITGRRRWALGALVAQLFLVPYYAAVLGADDLSPAVKAGSLSLLLAFSACYILFPGRVMQAPLGRRVAAVGTLLLLTIPLFWVTGTATSGMWIFVAVAGGMLLPAEGAMGIGVALAALMLIIDQLAGEPLSWELALTLVALTAFMVGFAGDVQMPGMDGLAAATALAGRLPTCRVIILTTFGRPGYLRRAMEAHAAGFLVKDAPAEQLVDAIRRVHAGLRVVDPELAVESLSLGESPLTGRERDVLAATADGGTIGQIAARLYLSEGTVRNHLSSVIGKTGASTRADALRIATDRGWI